MSITGMTLNEFCKDAAEQAREGRRNRRRLLKALREAEMDRARAQETYDRTRSHRAHARLVDATTRAIAAATSRKGR